MVSAKVPEQSGKGRAVVATRDFIPGEIVFREQPLVLVTAKLMDSFEKYAPSQCGPDGLKSAIWAVEKLYNILSLQQQEIFMNIYYPTYGATTSETVDRVRYMGKIYAWEASKIETLIKIALIYTFNAFSVKGTQRIYANKLPHSCRANCRIDFPNGSKSYCVWTAISHIKSGEGMSVSYGSHRYDTKPIPFRRDYYSFSRELHCSCVRCAALGDDTRQFNCMDKSCLGVHLVSQPTSDHAARLMPCNVCSHKPSSTYQLYVLSWERNVDNFRTQCMEAIRRGFQGPWDIHYPDCHLGSILLSQAMFHQTKNQDIRMVFAKRFIKPIDLLSLPPNVQHCEWFVEAAQMFMKTRLIEGVSLAKHYARKAVRHYKIMFGRDTMRTEDAEVVLCAAIFKRPAEAAQTTVCMFCQETRDNAYLKLSLCGCCKTVAYCGVRCQTAHWKFHKSICGLSRPSTV